MINNIDLFLIQIKKNIYNNIDLYNIISKNIFNNKIFV